MMNESLYSKYERKFEHLIRIIQESSRRVTDEDKQDDLFFENVNFFIKAYMVNICTYLEAYLQDVLFDYHSILSLRLKGARLPYNFLYSKMAKEIKSKDLKFESAEFLPNKRLMASDFSANVNKTIEAFRLVGVNLKEADGFQQNKEIVAAVVYKRNEIIHHNDQAMDISFTDLLEYIAVFLEYMKSISEVMGQHKREIA